MRRIEPPAGQRDLGYERQRLTQRLNDRAELDPDGFAELGALCFEMNDLFHAGRIWLFSSATGEHVEQAVDYFAERCHRKPRSILSQVPKYVLIEDVSGYPGVIRDRLSRLGISAEDIRERRSPQDDTSGSRGAWIAVAVVVYLFGCLVLGIGTSVWLLYKLASWLF